MMLNRSLRDRVLQSMEDAENLVDRIEMHDGWVLLLASIYGKAGVVDEPLVYYRQHRTNVMGAVSESRPQKLIRNLKDLLSGQFAAEKKQFHEKEKELARLLLQQKDLPSDVRKTMTELLKLRYHGKLYRMHWYRVNGLTRAHHDFWMRLWV